MFFHLGIPTFVSVINTGHLVEHSRGCLHGDFDVKMWLDSWSFFSQRGCQTSHWAACVGMINVTNHLLTRGGQSFGLSVITLLVPAVFSPPLLPVDTFISPGQNGSLRRVSSTTRYKAAYKALIFCGDKGFLLPLSFIFGDFSFVWNGLHIMNTIQHFLIT